MISRAAAGLLLLAHLIATTLTASISPNILSLWSSVSNLTLPINGTLSESSHLPSDPFPYEIPGTELIVIFSSYQAPLPVAAVDQAIQKAQDDCIYKAPSVLMPRRRLRYTEPGNERVNLKVTPRSMIWSEWKLVIDSLATFVSRWGPVVLNFNVVRRSQPLISIGRGYLEDNSDDFEANGVKQS